jgi:hypothetical protein
MTLLRKIDFAAHCNVHRSRVSHWIRDGHISGPAIVGSGRKAMIDADIALRQLRERLDVDGLVRTGLNTRLYPAPAKRAAPTARQAVAVTLADELGLYENAARRLARALVIAGWPVTEQGAWNALIEGLNTLDNQREDAEEAAKAA